MQQPEIGPFVSIPETITSAATTIRLSSEYPAEVGPAIADWLDSTASRWEEIRHRWEGQHALAIAMAATEAAARTQER
jgi:hypothetical protein